MNKEKVIYRDEFVKEIWENSQRFCKEEGVDAPQYVEVDKIFEIVEKYKDKEIERLNNIIDELEKWIKEDKEYAMNNFECGRCFNMFDILNKLKELKGESN